jgi:hypothetical protein
LNFRRQVDACSAASRAGAPVFHFSNPRLTPRRRAEMVRRLYASTAGTGHGTLQGASKTAIAMGEDYRCIRSSEQL